jgi:hypothetical protein
MFDLNLPGRFQVGVIVARRDEADNLFVWASRLTRSSS